MRCSHPHPHATGTLPESLGNLAGAVALYFGNSWLHGTLPAGIGKLTNLEHLEIGNPAWARPGGLSSISVDFSNLTRLQVLDLHANIIEGPIPVGLARLTQLYTLSLNQNYLNGGIPASLAALTSLVSCLVAGTGSSRTFSARVCSTLTRRALCFAGSPES